MIFLKLHIKIVLLNKSLVKNFKDNLMKCGYELFRTNQYWEFHKIIDSKDPMMGYAKTLGIPKSLITKNNGAWFIDFSKSSNYDSLNQFQLWLFGTLHITIKRKFNTDNEGIVTNYEL